MKSNPRLKLVAGKATKVARTPGRTKAQDANYALVTSLSVQRVGHPLRDAHLRAATAQHGSLAHMAAVHLPFALAGPGNLRGVRAHLSAQAPARNAGAGLAPDL